MDKLKSDLLESYAKQWAESFIHPKRPQDKRFQNPKLTSAQLRRFHNDIRSLEAKVLAGENMGNDGKENFTRYLPLVKMVKSKVAYACPANGRDRKVPEEFRNFIEIMIDSIGDLKDFRAFSMCFEAVVGYFYGEGGR